MNQIEVLRMQHRVVFHPMF